MTKIEVGSEVMVNDGPLTGVHGVVQERKYYGSTTVFIIAFVGHGVVDRVTVAEHCVEIAPKWAAPVKEALS